MTSDLDLLPIEDITIDFKSSSQWETTNSCIVYSFVLDPGVYYIEAQGASGGSYREEDQSPGGISSGTLELKTATRLFAVAGSVGKSSNEDQTEVPGGCNGGGNGFTSSTGEYFSGGGGASHISVVENSLSHRILVAGGAGGSFFGSGFGKGGEGGAPEANSGSTFSSSPGVPGEGGNQTSAGLSCSPGAFGAGGAPRGEAGCGGGGGWFGGAPSCGSNAGAGGGSGFVFYYRDGTPCPEIDEHPLIDVVEYLTNTLTWFGTQKGNGSVRITLISSPTPRPTKPLDRRSLRASLPVTLITRSLPRRILNK